MNQNRKVLLDSFVSSLLVSLFISYIAITISKDSPTQLIHFSTSAWITLFMLTVMVHYLFNLLIVTPFYYLVNRMRGLFTRIVIFNTVGALLTAIIFTVIPKDVGYSYLLIFTTFPLFFAVSQLMYKLFKQ